MIIDSRVGVRVHHKALPRQSCKTCYFLRCRCITYLFNKIDTVTLTKLSRGDTKENSDLNPP